MRRGLRTSKMPGAHVHPSFLRHDKIDVTRPKRPGQLQDKDNYKTKTATRQDKDQTKTRQRQDNYKRRKKRRRKDPIVS